ncbi:unnamed protein product [Sphagnum balticum]
MLAQRGDRAIMAVSEHPRHCDPHRFLVDLLRQLFRGAVIALIFQEPPRPPVFCFRDMDSSRASFPPNSSSPSKISKKGSKKGSWSLEKGSPDRPPKNGDLAQIPLEPRTPAIE